jgi:hypothetical protein
MSILATIATIIFITVTYNHNKVNTVKIIKVIIKMMSNIQYIVNNNISDNLFQKKFFI